MPEYLFLYGTLLPELAPPLLRTSLATLRRLGEQLQAQPAARLENVVRGSVGHRHRASP